MTVFYQIYKVAHGLLLTVSGLWSQNGDSCENKNYGSNLDQFLGNFFYNFLSKIRKFIFHSFIHFVFIFDKSILIFHHYATFLWLEIIFPTSTIKMKLKHQVKWQSCDFQTAVSRQTFCSILFKICVNIGKAKIFVLKKNECRNSKFIFHFWLFIPLIQEPTPQK